MKVIFKPVGNLSDHSVEFSKEKRGKQNKIETYLQHIIAKLIQYATTCNNR